jgi:uncharacterized membrane protein
MTDSNQISVDPNTRGNANLIYILYLVGTSIVGVVMAYIGKGQGDAVLESHYNNQINIFWKGFLYSVVSVILIPILGLGILTGLATLVWHIVRCVKGMQALSAGQPIDNPGSWLF